MTRQEKRYLERVHNCLNIPCFASGLQTTTVKGLSSYSKDCAYVLPKVQNIIYMLGCGEPYPGAIDEDIEEIEEWTKERKSEDWK